MISVACSIGVNSNQDRSWSISRGSYSCVVVCDGVGQHKQSGEVADILIEKVKVDQPVEFDDLYAILEESKLQIERQKLVGGTTFLIAWGNNNGDRRADIKISALGNGGVVRTRMNDLIAKRYHVFCDLFLPHVTESGALYRHISHNSGEAEMQMDHLSIPLNSVQDDVLILFSDGLFSLEHAVIANSEEGHVWRYRDHLLFKLMDMIREFIIEFKNSALSTQELNQHLGRQLHEFLREHNEQGFFNDDVAIGILIPGLIRA